MKPPRCSPLGASRQGGVVQEPDVDMSDNLQRPRRRRRSQAIRDMVRETPLTPDRLVLPLFLCEGSNISQPIAAIPGRSRTSLDLGVRESEAALKLGVQSVCLFPQVPQ